ncbi:hypothetical protein GGS23DRAFT_227310 [Durotheca rogersii]|uniref:uncharacterized protein n=1 Tax=Durotheca rogersii TaxID=419775 RepID=UPI00222051E3|nr:uncharacterized protein GGS23DRAFT_227310 [Durotheca rogersii]KAI5860523.1 hypothetical protein GGS23DRAFT_227310 [Durotheca rogersii]
MAPPLGAVQIIIVSVIAFVFSVICLGLRLWSRRIKAARLVFSDYMVIAATVINTGALVNALISCAVAGVGRHFQDVLVHEPALLQRFLKVFMAEQALWAGANTCVKFSISALYMAIFPNKRFAYICYGAMAISAANLIMNILKIFLICKPVHYIWDQSIPGGSCGQQRTATIISGIVNLVIDTFIVALPMPMLLGLQLLLPRKLGVAGMFSLGAGLCYVPLRSYMAGSMGHDRRDIYCSSG